MVPTDRWTEVNNVINQCRDDWVALHQGGLEPPKMDRLDVAGGLNPGSSEPGNYESTGSLSVRRKRLPQRYLLLFYALPNTYPVPDRKDFALEGALRERRNVIPGTVILH
jgi:hypothetical protein